MGKYHKKSMDYEVYHYTIIFLNTKHTKILVFIGPVHHCDN